MRALSRNTLLLPKPKTLISVWWFLGLFGVLWILVLLFKTGVIFLSLVSVFSLLVFVVSLFEHRRIRRLAGARKTDSICSFARSFDCHNVDPRIIRAVYEALQSYYHSEASSFPIRATDSFKNDLKLDPEDLDDIARSIGFRTQRSMDCPEMNPFYGKVKTVNELVLFFTHQPISSHQ